MLRIFLYSVIFTLILIKKCFAYLDPGTASIVIQAIIGAIATTAITIGIYWRKFTDFCRRMMSIFSKSKKINK